MTVQTAPPAIDWQTRTVSVCGGEIAYVQAGSGPPLLLLPRDSGHPPRHDFRDFLASAFTVVYPWLPGFHGGKPARWEWLSSTRDLAVVLRQFLSALAIQRPTLAGAGFGGWIAAEMATMAPDDLAALVLVAPMGLQPRDSFIFDQFIGNTEGYVRHGFVDQDKFDAVYGKEPDFEQLEGWETDREMTARLAWKPYMYNPTLPRLLSGVKAPALVVWGDSDAVVPVECAKLYGDALPNATVEVFAGSGHALDLEEPRGLAETVLAFCKRQS